MSTEQNGLKDLLSMTKTDHSIWNEWQLFWLICFIGDRSAD